jgi:hypothetical protein
VPNDYPIELCRSRIPELNAKGFNLLQKFTCSGCGQRLTMPDPNVFHDSGTCDRCGTLTRITHCNFLATTLSVDFLKRLMKD